MAKKKTAAPPSIEPAQQKKQKPKTFTQPTVQTNSLSFPTCEPAPHANDWFKAITLKGLSRTHTRAIIRIREGLNKSNATLANGQPIRDNTNALRWLIEEAGKSAGIE